MSFRLEMCQAPLLEELMAWRTTNISRGCRLRHKQSVLLGYPLSSSDNILSQPTVSTVNNSFTVTNGALTAENFLAVFTETNLDAIQLELISGIPQFLLVRFAHNGVNFDTIATSATSILFRKSRFLAPSPSSRAVSRSWVLGTAQET